MKLISCHIENFGKLQNFDYQFHDGKNVICADNGWGKSTLAAFIRVMLFGFDRDGKQSKLENERKRYAPWQRGTYGGTLVFEADGKRYRIMRTFDEKKAAGDHFALYDDATNLESNAFSSAVGPELFGIDADSFERTVFIGQQAVETDTTPDINAKIGNVSDETADMGRYDDAYGRLKRMTDQLTPHRATGQLKKLRSSIELLKNTVRNKDAVMSAIEKLRADIATRKESVHSDEDALKTVQERLTSLSTAKELLAEAKQYEMLQDDAKKASEAAKEARAFFPGEVPTMEAIAEAEQSLERARADRQSAENFALSEEEQRVLRRLTDRFAGEVPDESYYADINERLCELTALQEKKQGSAFVASPIVGGLLAAAGAISAVLAFALPSIRESGPVQILLFTGIGALLLVTGILLILQSAKREKELKKTAALINELREAEKTGHDAEKYTRLKQQKKRAKKAAESADIKEESVRRFIRGLQLEVMDDHKAQLSSIREQASQIALRGKEAEDRMEAVMAFEKTHDVGRYRIVREAGEHEDSMEDLNSRFAELKDRIDQEKETQRGLSLQLEQYLSEQDELEEREEELEQREEEYRELSHRYDVLTKTMVFLEAARTNFTARYMDPIKQSFDRYYGLIAGDDRRYELDAALGLKVLEQGELREIGYLSEGAKDLVGLCRRMAMVEAMYGQEKPFLIFDDPFVNLDDEKIRGAAKFLDEIANDYQILYISCSKNRA
ncbi:MAG: AAA family ATPase [Lachnospiraceae bacterium]|nr:AAA family ATPase [Lachnospiraceae bacterium]